MDFQYRLALSEAADELNEMMADLEDLRDEAQDCLDQTGDETVGQDVQRMDAALRLLGQAADLLDGAQE